MTEPRHTDDLAQRYLEASAQDPRRPPDRVRDAVRAHALEVIASRTLLATTNLPASDRPAANQSRWKIALLASVALAGMTGLLVLQFERGTPEEKELALGQATPRSESVASAAPTAPAPAPASASASATVVVPAAPTALPPPTAQAKTAAPRAKPQSALSPIPAVPAPAMNDSELAKSEPSGHADSAAMSSGTVSGGISGIVETAPTAATPARRVAPAAAAPVAAPLGTARAKARQSQGLQQAMIEVARLGNTAQLENLLQQGAALNASDETGRTALIWAVINNQTETVQKLLALGANKALKDHEGLSALQHAKRLNLDHMAALLEAAP